MTKRFAFISPEDGGFNFITWLDGASGPEDVWRIRGGEFASYLNGVSHDTESTGQLIHRTGRRRTSFDDDDAECSPQSAGTDGDSRFRESPVPVQFGSSEAQFGFEDPITLSRSTHSFLFTERADSVPFFFGVANT